MFNMHNAGLEIREIQPAAETARGGALNPAPGRDAAGRLSTVRHRGVPPRLSGFCYTPLADGLLAGARNG